MAPIAPRETPAHPRLFTVGHSNHSLEAFVALLQKNEIQCLVDVRSHPYSKYVPHFNQENLECELKREGIKYLFLGRELGGQPEEDEFYDDDGYVLYHRLAEAPLFLAGIERLEKGIRTYQLAILCSEEDPAGCHRHLLLGRVMAQRGARVYHIRGDGRLQTDSDLQRAEFVQPLLFDFSEEDTWKSLRAVARKKQQRDFSGSSADTESSDSP